MTDLTKNTELIEYVVAEVVRRLRQNDARQSGPSVGDCTLDFPERLVTLASLPRCLEGFQCITVMQDAVVTPAVFDELRDRGIRLERADRPGTVRSS